MDMQYVLFFGPLLAIFGLITGAVVWYRKTKKNIRAAQELWARAVARLGGRELDQRGPGGTRTFAVGDASLSMVNYVFLEENIARLVTPAAAPNSWQSQLTTPCRRATPPFVLSPLGTSNATGDSEFDARWTIAPLLNATQADVLSLLDDNVRRALCALPLGTYQIASGGGQICAFRGGAIDTERDVEALVTACALLAGAPPPTVNHHAAPIAAVDVGRTQQNWTWRYSPLMGVMYGPIPVGIIVIAVVAGIYLVAR